LFQVRQQSDQDSRFQRRRHCVHVVKFFGDTMKISEFTDFVFKIQNHFNIFCILVSFD
jgi:hypothetical protein